MMRIIEIVSIAAVTAAAIRVNKGDEVKLLIDGNEVPIDTRRADPSHDSRELIWWRIQPSVQPEAIEFQVGDQATFYAWRIETADGRVVNSKPAG